MIVVCRLGLKINLNQLHSSIELIESDYSVHLDSQKQFKLIKSSNLLNKHIILWVLQGCGTQRVQDISDLEVLPLSNPDKNMESLE